MTQHSRTRRPFFHFAAPSFGRRSRRAAGCALVVLLAAACGPPTPSPDGGTLPDGGAVLGQVELGTTNDQGAYVALTGDAFATPGAQGGFHVNTFFRLPAGGQGSITFDYRVVRASDDKLVSLGSRQFDLGLFKVDSWTNMTPVTIFMCPTPVGIDIIDRELVFMVKAKNADGQVLAEGSARAVFRCGPNAGTYCTNICKG